MAQIQDFRVRKGLVVSENTTIAGNTTISQQLAVTNAASFANTTSHTGAATFSNTVGITGATTLSSTLAVTGTSTFGAANATFDTNVLSIDATNNRVGVNTALGQTVAFVVTGSANVIGTFTATDISYTGSITGPNITAGTSNSSFDGGTLFVDAVNNRVGVNSTTPDAALAVTGSANVSSAMRVGGTFTAVGAASFSNTMSITGNATVGGTFGATGAATFSNTMAITGATTIASSLAITSTFSANGMSSNGNVTVTNGSFVGGLNGTANQCARSVSAGSYMTGGGALTGDITLTADAATTNSPNKLVARDASGDFSAGTITAAFNGIAASSNAVLYSGAYRSATDAATASTIMARDSNGDTYARYFRGTATSSLYADLAEKYATDVEYPIGTVIAVGGEKEVTAATTLNGQSVIGVISEKPAYLMNFEAEGQAVALKGRVPVRVKGQVNKGDRLTASMEPGVAEANNHSGIRVFGIALETSVDIQERLVEAVIL